MNFEEIETNLKKIRECLDLEVTGDDVDGVIGKMTALQVLEGLSSESMRWARKLRIDKQLETLTNLDILKAPATALKIKIDIFTANEQALELYAERLNAAIHHTVDGLRTIISLQKEQLITGRWQQNPR